ncbi:hypothetical protein, partial [Rhizobium dioscoreae]|uniref:hypothetical protein n=1 Tax=Rhizobium sp. NBRC 114257 TaxID=2994519 RepID=UPI002554785F
AFASQEKEVAPSLLASNPAMILNHKIKRLGISPRFRLALTDSSRRWVKVQWQVTSSMNSSMASARSPTIPFRSYR